MNFTIIWSEGAIDDIARVWLAATDRNAVTIAASQIDMLLAVDPHLVGESRVGNQRVAFSDPLGFRFDVIVDDLRVTVGAVWATRAV